MIRRAHIEMVEGGYIVSCYEYIGDPAMLEHRTVYTKIIDALVALALVFEPESLVAIENADLVAAVTEALESQDASSDLDTGKAAGESQASRS